MHAECHLQMRKVRGFLVPSGENIGAMPDMLTGELNLG